jgi:hypothetical protein
VSKPRGYYLEWSYQERCDYDAREREREDLEYRRQQVQEQLDRLQAQERELRREFRYEMQSAQDQREQLSDDVRREQANKDIAYGFIRSKGLWREFVDWNPPEDNDDVIEESPADQP